MKKVMVSAEKAKHFAKVACHACGIPDNEAKILANILVETDLRGVETHGLIRLPEYLERIQKGGMEAALNLRVITEWEWGGALDAGNGIGHVAAYKGMQWVIEKAKSVGIGMATMRMSNHFGMAAYYSLLAASQGMIGFVASNSAPLMAPWGGKEVKIGNNPFAMAIPGTNYPLSLDVACSVAARSKLYQAQRTGQQIPKDWALNQSGKKTTDPAEALKGALLPLAAHKGYGIAMMVDILSGVLSRGTVSPNIKDKNDYSSPRDIGHFFLAIDIEHFLPLHEFLKSVQTYIDILHESKPAHGYKNVRIPGEKSAHLKQLRLKRGIPYDETSLKILDDMANGLNISSLHRE